MSAQDYTEKDKHEDVKVLHGMGYAQELERRLVAGDHHVGACDDIQPGRVAGLSGVRFGCDPEMEVASVQLEAPGRLGVGTREHDHRRVDLQRPGARREREDELGDEGRATRPPGCRTGSPRSRR